MWTIENAANNSTNKATVPADGIISVTKPDSVQVYAYVNGVTSAVHHVHVKAGDTVHFKMKNTETDPAAVSLEYLGTVSNLIVPAATEVENLVISAQDGTISIKEDIMTPAETINLFSNPMGGNSGQGGAMGAGLGAGLVGGLLGTALFGRNGLGGVADGGVATAANVESVVNNTAILQGIADLKAAVPLAEAQVQLALAVSQADINANISGRADSILSTINTQSITNANYIAGVNSNVSQTGAMNLAATKDAAAMNLAATNAAALASERQAYAVTQAINNDGDKTRALIQSIDKTNDSRMITNLANEISDLKNSRNLDVATGNITISNTNNATAVAQQQQAQQQQQLQYQILSQLGILAGDLQTVKQGQVIFNSGAMTGSATQAAANTRVA